MAHLRSSLVTSLGPHIKGMAAGAATYAATRCHPTLPSVSGRVRSSKCFFGRDMKPLDQFVRRGWEAGKGNSRIYGAPPKTLEQHQPIKTISLPPGFEVPAPCVSETKYASQSLIAKATNFSPKPDIFNTRQNLNAKANPDIFMRCVDKDYHEYFIAHSVEEDGSISPKYYIYPPVKEDYIFTGATCNGLFDFQSMQWDHLLWNPTTNEFKILPKSFVEHPRVTNYEELCGMWADHRCDDFKVLQVVFSDTANEEGENIDLRYQIRLYSLESNSWKNIPCTEFGYIAMPHVCINGFFYCKASLEKTHVILSFDFSTETLSSLPLPSDMSLADAYLILEYNGLLSVLVYSGDEIVPTKYELWVMKAGLWTRESVFHARGVRQPVWFSKNGGLLYFESLVDDELLVFDRACGKLKHLGIYCFSGRIEFYTSFESSDQVNGVEDVEELEKEEYYEYMIEASHGPSMPA